MSFTISVVSFAELERRQALSAASRNESLS